MSHYPSSRHTQVRRPVNNYSGLRLADSMRLYPPVSQLYRIPQHTLLSIAKYPNATTGDQCGPRDSCQGFEGVDHIIGKTTERMMQLGSCGGSERRTRWCYGKRYVGKISMMDSVYSGTVSRGTQRRHGRVSDTDYCNDTPFAHSGVPECSEALEGVT